MVELLTPREAASRLRISVKSVRRLVAAGMLRYVQVGVSYCHPRKMFTAGDLEEFITNQTKRDQSPMRPAIGSRTRQNGNAMPRYEGFTAIMARKDAEKATKQEERLKGQKTRNRQRGDIDGAEMAARTRKLP